MDTLYLLNTKKTSKVAHIWMGDNTACKSWLNNGIKNRTDYTLNTDTGNRKICGVCLSNLIQTNIKSNFNRFHFQTPNQEVLRRF